MTPAQVKAAQIVIGKIRPDLKAVELTGAEGGPVVISLDNTDNRA